MKEKKIPILVSTSSYNIYLKIHLNQHSEKLHLAKHCSIKPHCAVQSILKIFVFAMNRNTLQLIKYHAAFDKGNNKSGA